MLLPALPKPRSLALRLALSLWVLGCGGGNPAQKPPAGAKGEAEATRGGEASASLPPANWADLPALPAASSSGEAREAPSISSVDEADKALAAGFYKEAEEALEKLVPKAGARALLVLGRLELETGRYERAAAHAREAARDGTARIAAETLRGEALAKQGELDGAERALRAVVGEAGAHRARVLLGQLLLDRGKDTEARSLLYRLIDAYNDESISMRDGEGLAYVGMAAWALGAFQDANEAFQQATRADPGRIETQLAWARMFLEKYDAGHAEESVRHALEKNPEHPEAHVLLARIVIEQSFDFAEAEERIERALEVNPNLAMAHVTRAGIALRDQDLRAADAHLSRALGINPHELEALSLRVAVRYMAGDDAGLERAKQEVLKENPGYSQMFSVIAEYADWEHRYPDMVDMAREALKIDSGDALAWATLGLNLLRMGDEDEGLKALRESWRHDRYNVRVYNTLNLYDDVIPQEYETFEADPFIFRMHKKERPMLERYVPHTLRRAYGDMRKRYGYTPKGPIRVELYGSGEHFATRTTGLPRLGVQGVCFGKVVTALSPAGGPFNWGQITWHELAHVFHIQLSKNRVPRWFTEGLAEYEATIARPEWRREMDYLLFRAIESGRFPSLRFLNRTFTHAKDMQDIMTAYYASTQVVIYIVDRFGFQKIPAMLREWSRDTPTPAVVKKVLGVDIDELDRDFRAHTKKRLSTMASDFYVDFRDYRDLEPLKQRLAVAPDDPDAQAALAAGLMVAGDAEGAEAMANKAISKAKNQPLARFLLARIAFGKSDAQTAESHLRAIVKGGKDGYEIRLLLAQAALGRKDAAVAKAELEAAVRMDADRADAWQLLAGIAERTNDDALRMRALTRLVQLEEHDREASAALLSLLAEKKRWAELVKFGEMALYLDPHNPETHRHLAEGYLGLDRAREALRELDAALVAGPEAPAPVHLARVRAFLALGRVADAKKAAQKAREADASVEEVLDEVCGGRC